MPETKTSLLPLRLEGVSYTVEGRALLDGISLELGSGGPTFVLGPNGAGKTLLLRACHGLLTPTAGRVTWGSVERTEALRRQAMVFQRPVLLRRSAQANIEHALRLRKCSRENAESRAIEALERAGLSGLSQRPARLLSGGEQQRVAIARAWALDPELLFMDEPTANLDPQATQAIEGAIGALDQAGVILLVTTHDLPQARRLAQRIVFMHKGRVLEDAPAERFFARPATPEGQAFLRGDLVV